MNEWIDTRECTPLTEGVYIIQTIYGDVTSMNYTTEAGWNTHRERDGNVYADKAINDGYVARWFNTEPPMPVPDAWRAEYRERNKICVTE